MLTWLGPAEELLDFGRTVDTASLRDLWLNLTSTLWSLASYLNLFLSAHASSIEELVFNAQRYSAFD